MSIEETIRAIIKEELDEFLISMIEQLGGIKSATEPEPPKPKRKRKTKAEKEAEEMEAIEKEMEPDEHQQISDEIDAELAEAEAEADEQVETVEVIEAHDLLREVKALVAASDKDDAKNVAKSVLSKFKVDKFTDVPEDKRIDCLSEVRRVLT